MGGNRFALDTPSWHDIKSILCEWHLISSVPGKALSIREACQAIRNAFSKPSLVNLDGRTIKGSLGALRLKSIFLPMIMGLLILLKEPSSEKALLTLHVMTEMHFLLQKKTKNIMHGRVKMYVMR